MKRSAMVVALWAFMLGSVFAQKGGSEQDLSKEARTLFESGQYLKAYPLYSQLVSLYPQNADYNLHFGACAIYSDADKTKAIRYLTIASKKGATDPMLYYYLGKAYHLNYQFKEAVKNYEEFEAKADPKLSTKYNTKREIETCIYGSNLLSNIKDLVVLNKTEADKNNFFRYMNLDGIGGKILTVPDALQSKLDQKSERPGVIHYPGNSTTIYFSSFGKDGSTGRDIYRAQMLPDGKFTEPVKLKGDVNTKYDEDFAFMHSDGKTLYFSSKGHNSMGGYDIFKSVYDPSTDSFGPAINLDFAINTPDDDIFYVADSLNKRAYFASGRTSDIDHLHVYNVMVEGVPLQVVYMKGNYVSDFDAEQKTVNIKIKDKNTGRIVSEAVSQSASGNYLTFVDKAGSYTYIVKTENSPQEHQVDVDIPSFPKPVAVRQEMRLINEGGKERLDIKTFFETPLDEDLAALAADMLRAKAGLSVNASAQDIETKSAEAKETASAAPQLSVEKTLANAPLAAGFAEGVTTSSILEGMTKDAQKAENFVAEADKKEQNAMAYALKKQQEADEVLTRAEKMRAEAGNYGTADDIAKLKESYVLTAQARDLQREAMAAFEAATAVNQYKATEKTQLDSLRKQIEAIKTGETTNNFDAVYAGLTAEKQRQVALREGKGSPYEEMLNKARAKESAKRSMEEQLVKQRTKEQELIVELKTAENRLTNAKKKTEKEEAALKVEQVKSDLAAKRRDIVLSTEKIEALGEEVKQAYASADAFKKVSEDSSMGLATTEQIAVDDIQRKTTEAKIKAMGSRIAALRITDPQMLALVSDVNLDQNSIAAVTNAELAPATSSTPTNENTASTSTTENTASTSTTTSENTLSTSTNASNVAPVSAANPTAANSTEAANNAAAAPTNGATTPATSAAANTTTPATSGATNTTTAAAPTTVSTTTTTAANAAAPSLKVDNAATAPVALQEAQAATNASLNRIQTLEGVNLPAARNMLLSNTVAQAEMQIARIYAKDQAVLTEQDRTELAAWTALRNDASAQMDNSTAASAPSNEVLRNTYTTVMPDYANETLNINNAPGTELERTVKQLEYKQRTLDRLRMAKVANAEKAMAETDATKLNEMAQRDAELESAIQVLNSELNDPAAYKAAYDNDIKATMSGDMDFNEKLNDQIAISQAYVVTLDAMEEAKQNELATTIDPLRKKAIENFLTEVRQEKIAAENKITSYESDLKLLASTSDQSSTSKTGNATRTVTTSVVAPESLTESTRQAAKEKVAEDAATMQQMFKPSPVTNSIFAYENGNLELLAQNYTTEKAALKNQDKIKQVNEDIFLVEAEIEIESNEGRQKKLDKEAEMLYAKRAGLEVANAEPIAAMSNAAYQDELKRAQSAIALNEEKLNDRVVLRDEVNKLLQQAQAEFDEAQTLRKNAGPVEDIIEKNDYFRRAYAKELHAIQLLQQVQRINRNIDPLLMYDNEQLTTLRYGTKANIEEMAVQSAPALLASGALATARSVSETATTSTGTTETTTTETTENALAANAASNANTDAANNTSTNGANMTNAGSNNTTTTDVAANNTTTTASPSTSGAGAGIANNVEGNNTPDNTAVNTTSGNVDASNTSSNASVGTNSGSTNSAANNTTNTNAAASNNAATTALTNNGSSNNTNENNQGSNTAANNSARNSNAANTALNNTSSSTPTVTSTTTDATENNAATNNSANNTSANNLSLTNSTGANTSTDATVNTSTNTSANNSASNNAATETTTAADSAVNTSTTRNAVGNNTSTGTEVSDVNSSNTAARANGTESPANTNGASAGMNSRTSTLPGTAGYNSLALPPSGYTLNDAIADGSFRPSEAGYYSEEDARDFFYTSPEYLYKNLFVKTGRGVYSESNPIPVDGAMPKGIYYMVQVGAFRNRIPQNLYDEFAPVHGETVASGITRYCAGYFLSFEKADLAKIDIRRLGYADAFVVAFKDGKRIPIYDAIATTEPDYLATMEKEFAPKTATEVNNASVLNTNTTATNATVVNPPASVNATAATPASTPSNTATSAAPKRTDYLTGVANAAPAVMVESTKGLFFAVQVGVYSKPVSLDKLFNLSEINSELTATQKIRYTSGRFTSLGDAVNRRMEARSKGIADAFITAYYNGERISLSKADELLKEQGNSILYQGK